MATDEERNAAARSKWYSSEPVFDRFASSTSSAASAQAHAVPPMVDRFAGASSFAAAAAPPPPATPAPPQQPSVDFSQTTVVGSTRWLRLESIKYSTPASDGLKPWDRIVRTTKKSETSPDAVAILAVLSTGDIVFVKQFRPAINAMTIELPAGLIDAGETPATAAVREFKEETGFTGVVKSMSSLTGLSPGMSNESCVVVTLDVDVSSPVNANAKPLLESAEVANLMSTLLLKKSELLDRLREEEAKGCVVFTAVYTLALGLSMS
jgi:hypothetical protein